MVNFSQLNIKELARWYYFANTPAYLFRHYRSDETLQAFANSHTVDELAEEVVRIAQGDPQTRSIHEIVIAYASLVAMTFKNVREVREALAPHDLGSLAWAHRILNLWEPYPTISETMELSSPVPQMTELVLQMPEIMSDVNTISETI